MSPQFASRRGLFVLAVCSVLCCGFKELGAHPTSTTRPTTAPSTSRTGTQQVEATSTSGTAIVESALPPTMPVRSLPKIPHKPFHGSLRGLHIVFDQSLGQIYSPYDPSFEGFSELGLSLRRYGAHVSLNNQPLVHRLAKAAYGTILVLGVSSRLRYSAAQRRALHAFLKRGGSLLQLSEHDNMFAIADRQNQISAPLGIHTLPTGAQTTRRDVVRPEWGWSRQSAWGLDFVALYYPAPLQLRASAKPLLWLRNPSQPQHRIVAAYRSLDRGLLVVLGDAEVFWNGVSRFGIAHAQNLSFRLRLFAMLGRKLALPTVTPGHNSLPSTSPSSRPSTHPSSRPGTSTKPRLTTSVTQNTKLRPAPHDIPNSAARRPLALFWSSGLHPTGTLTRFARWLQSRGYRTDVGEQHTQIKQASLVVLANPLRPLRHIPQLRRVPRLLIFGDGYSGLLHKQPRLANYFARQLGQAVTQDVHPLNPLLAHWGLHLRRGTVISQSLPAFRVPFRWSDGRRGHVYRSTVFLRRSKNTHRGWHVLAKTAPKTWFAPFLTPIQHTDRPDDDPFRLPTHPTPGGAILALCSPQVFAMADVDALTDQQFHTQDGQRLRQAIDTWLKRRHWGGRKRLLRVQTPTTDRAH